MALLLVPLLLLCSSLTHHFVHDTTGLLIKLDVLKHKTEMDKWVNEQKTDTEFQTVRVENEWRRRRQRLQLTTMTEASTQRLLLLLLRI